MKVPTSQAWRSTQAPAPAPWGTANSRSEWGGSLGCPTDWWHCPRVQGLLWGAGKSISAPCKTCSGLFRGPRSEKRGCFGEDQAWEYRERRVWKEPISHEQALVCRRLSLIRTVCLIFSLNSISSNFPGCRVPWAVCMCGQGLSARHPLEVSGGCFVWVPAHGETRMLYTGQNGCLNLGASTLYIFPTYVFSSWSASKRNRMRSLVPWCEDPVGLSMLMCMASRVYMDVTYRVCMWACACPRECVLGLAAGWTGEMELQQSHLCRAARSGTAWELAPWFYLIWNSILAYLWILLLHWQIRSAVLRNFKEIFWKCSWCRHIWLCL